MTGTPEDQTGNKKETRNPSGNLRNAHVWIGGHNDLPGPLYTLANPQFKNLDGTGQPIYVHDGGPSHGNNLGVSWPNRANPNVTNALQASWNIFSSHTVEAPYRDKWGDVTYIDYNLDYERPNIGTFSLTGAQRHDRTLNSSLSTHYVVGAHAEMSDPGNFTQRVQRWVHGPDDGENLRVPDYEEASGERQRVSANLILQKGVTHRGGIGRLETQAGAIVGTTLGVGVRNGHEISMKNGYNTVYGQVQGRIGKNLDALPTQSIAFDSDNVHSLPFAPPSSNARNAWALQTAYHHTGSITKSPLMQTEKEHPFLPAYGNPRTPPTYPTSTSVGHVDVGVVAKIGRFLGELGVSTNVNDPNHSPDLNSTPMIRTPNIYTKLSWQIGK